MPAWLTKWISIAILFSTYLIQDNGIRQRSMPISTLSHQNVLYGCFYMKDQSALMNPNKQIAQNKKYRKKSYCNFRFDRMQDG